jgi:hypothetical protein
LLLMSAMGIILIRGSGRDLGSLPSKESSTNSIVPAPTISRDDSKPGRIRTRRPTLEESLPPGSKVIDSKRILGGIEVIFADGSHINARGASVTANGISFERPYEFSGPKGSSIDSKDSGSVFLIARDLSSFKMIPAPGGTTSFSTPVKITEAEQDGTEQPATRSESDSEGDDNPQPEAEGRSR